MPTYAVTGASRGIGLEFVRQLSEQTENLVFALVRSEKTATRISELGRSNVRILEADVTNYEALKVAADEVSKVTGGKLDMLINNAGLIPPERKTYLLDTYPKGEERLLEKDLSEAFDVNVIGVVRATNAFLPLLHAGTLKKVVSLASGFGDLDLTIKLGVPYSPAYSISKAALNMAVAKYAVEHKKDGFVFLSLSPGFVNTRIAPPTVEDIEAGKLIAPFLGKIAPPTFKGPITPQESVEAMLEVINAADVESTGAFISHHGNKEWV